MWDQTKCCALQNFCPHQKQGPMSSVPKKTSLTSPLLQLGVEALKERYLRHIIAPTRPQGERTLHLDIIRKDSTPSGQEELHTESLTVTVKEGAEEPVTTKPGLDM